MTESDSDCSESTDDNNQNNHRTGSQFHHSNQNDHSYLDFQNVCHDNNLNSRKDSEMHDNIIEVCKTNHIELQANVGNASLRRHAILDVKSTEENSADVTPNLSIRSIRKYRTLDNHLNVTPNLKSIRKYRTLDNHMENCVNAQGEEITEMSNKDLPNKETIHDRPKGTLTKYRTIDDDANYSYQGVSDRIQKLNIIYSSDKVKEDDTSITSKTSPKQETFSVTEKRKLVIDPGFEQKMNELYLPSPSKGTTATNNWLCNTKNNDKFTFNRADSNCEIIEENLSPVSETTKQLEHQLSFPTSPKSHILSPKIPKTTRFARLNKYLNETPDHENTVSQRESLDQSYVTD